MVRSDIASCHQQEVNQQIGVFLPDPNMASAKQKIYIDGTIHIASCHQQEVN
jgi:hypothetical protein